MRLAIFTLVEHIEHQGKYYGYAPYIREMNLWNSHFNAITIVAPRSKLKTMDAITIPYQHPDITFVEVPVFNIKSIASIFKLLTVVPKLVITMVKVMRQSDHFHFRSPSNIAAIAAIVQVFFPKKKKTMRYTGNWDPKSHQPIGYKFQKWLFSNTFLTRNMIALVYGNWQNQSKNINPFFAATFSNSEKEDFIVRSYNSELNFVFTGALVSGKQPLLAIQIAEALQRKGLNLKLDIYGDGPLKPDLEGYISNNNLKDSIVLHGNQNKEIIKKALKRSHFTILPSKSEGWPKAIAEGMFFGSIPISTKISCLNWILDNGNRGILIEPNLEEATSEISKILTNANLIEISRAAQSWSQKYTIERQKDEISKLLE